MKRIIDAIILTHAAYTQLCLKTSAYVARRGTNTYVMAACCCGGVPAGADIIGAAVTAACIRRGAAEGC